MSGSHVGLTEYSFKLVKHLALFDIMDFSEQRQTSHQPLLYSYV